jgi:hypothetical protein
MDIRITITLIIIGFLGVNFWIITSIVRRQNYRMHIERRAQQAAIIAAPIALTKRDSFEVYVYPCVKNADQLTMIIDVVVVYDPRANLANINEEVSAFVQSETVHWALRFNETQEALDAAQCRTLGLSLTAFEGPSYRVSRAAVQSIRPSKPPKPKPTLPIIEELSYNVHVVRELSHFHEWVSKTHPEIRDDPKLWPLFEKNIAANKRSQLVPLRRKLLPEISNSTLATTSATDKTQSETLTRPMLPEVRRVPPVPQVPPLIRELLDDLKSMKELNSFQEIAAIAYPELRKDEESWKVIENKIDRKKHEMLESEDE